MVEGISRHDGATLRRSYIYKNAYVHNWWNLRSEHRWRQREESWPVLLRAARCNTQSRQRSRERASSPCTHSCTQFNIFFFDSYYLLGRFLLLSLDLMTSSTCGMMRLKRCVCIKILRHIGTLAFLSIPNLWPLIPVLSTMFAVTQDSLPFGGEEVSLTQTFLKYMHLILFCKVSF